jgi:hypothetical protein
MASTHVVGARQGWNASLERKPRCHINGRVGAADKAADFPTHIRQGVPGVAAGTSGKTGGSG